MALSVLFPYINVSDCSDRDSLINLFKLYFIMLLQLFQFLPLCVPPPSVPYSLRQSPHHCSCPWVMCIHSLSTSFPLLYFISPWLFCNYLFVLLNPLTSSLITHSPPHTSHLATIKTFSVSLILSLFLFAEFVF